MKEVYISVSCYVLKLYKLMSKKNNCVNKVQFTFG